MIETPLEARVAEHLPKEDALGDVEDARVLRGNIVEPDAVAHLAAESDAAFLGHALGEHAGREAPGLQDDADAVLQQTALQEDLGNLRGFARTRGGLKDETGALLQAEHDFFIQVVDRQGGHCSLEMGRAAPERKRKRETRWPNAKNFCLTRT